MTPSGEPTQTRHSTENRHSRWLLALLLLVPLVLVGPGLLPDKRFLPQLPVQLSPLATEHPELYAAGAKDSNLLMADRLLPYLTDQHEIRRQVHNGVWPTWEPKLGMGVPIPGGTLVGLYYPPNWLTLVLPPDVAASWLALFCLLAGGLGTWLLLRRLGLAPAAALCGVVAFQTGGWALANLHLPMKVDAAVWLPWSLWAVEGLLRGARGSGPLLFLTIALSFLAGWIPIAVFAAGVVVVFAITRWIQLGRPRGLLLSAAFVALGVGAAAVQVLPMIEASTLSVRQEQSAARLAAQTIPLGSAVSLVAPHAFGDPRQPLPSPNAIATWVSGAHDGDRALAMNPLEWNAFAGLGVALLALLAVFAAPRAAALPGLLLLATWGFAQGWPGFDVLYRIPGLNFGAPNRILALQWLLLPWLAAIGAEGLRRGERSVRIALLATTLVSTLAVFLFWVTFDAAAWAADLVDTVAARFNQTRPAVLAALPEASRLAAGRAVAASCEQLLVACVAMSLVAGCAFRWPRVAFVGVLLVIAAEGIHHGRAHLVPRTLDGEVFPPSKTIDAIAKAAGDGRVLRLDESPGETPQDVIHLARPNLLEAYGISDVTPYYVFTPRSLVELFDAMHPKTRYRTMPGRIPDESLIGHPILDLLRVTCLLSTRPLQNERLNLVYERPGFHVYHRTGTPTAVHFVGTAIETKSDDAALERLVTGPFDATQQVVLAPGAKAGEGLANGTVDSRRVSASRIEATVDSPTGGWVVFHDQFYPGWSATIDGEAVEIVRVNHAQRAVKTAPGKHSIVMEYSPGSVRWGLAITLLALGIAVFLSYRYYSSPSSFSAIASGTGS